MNQKRNESLADQSETLRQKLAAQRQVVGFNLGPTTSTSADYPRSLTMQFLLKRPDLVLSLLAPITRLMARSRLLRSAPVMLLMIIIVRRFTHPGIRQTQVHLLAKD